MALKDCIAKFEKAGVPVSPDQITALEGFLERGMSDEQAVRAVSLQAHQNVVDIAHRARNEGAVLAPVTDPVTDLVRFQAKALQKLGDKSEALNTEILEIIEEFKDASTILNHFRQMRPAAGRLYDWAPINDTSDDKVLMDLMIQFSFNRQRKPVDSFGLKGTTPLELFDSFRAIKVRQDEITARLAELKKEGQRIDEQVEVIFHGKQQTFYQLAKDAPKLTVRHNLSGDNLQFTDEMGGLALPSLALMPEGAALNNMGEISLIGTEDLGDPAKVPVHDADVYTATYPPPKWTKVKGKDAEPLTNEMLVWALIMEGERNLRSTSQYRQSVDLVWGYLVNDGNPDQASNEMLRSNGVKAWFLHEVYGEDSKPTIEDAEPRYAVSWTTPVLDFFATDQSAENFNWEDPRRLALYKRAGDAFIAGQKIHLRSLYEKAGIDDDVINEMVEDELKRAGVVDPDTGRMYLSHYDQIKRDVARKGDKRVSDMQTGETLDSKLRGREAEFQGWVTRKVEALFGEPRLRLNGRWVPYTLDNIVRKMKAQPLRGAEDTMTFGEGKARAESAVRISSLQEARNRAETQIADPDTVNAARDKAKKLLEDWRGKVIEFYSGTTYQGRLDTWNALDASMRALAYWANNSMRMGSEKALLEGLKREEFGRISDSILQQGLEAGRAFLEAPVPYFEAKPRRAVMLSEFAGAVIPSDATAETRAILAKHGITYKEYQVGENIDSRKTRTDAVTEFTQILNDQGERVLFQSEIGFTSGLLTAAQTMPREKGSAVEMMNTLRKQPNVKKQELEWLGVAEWMEARGLQAAMQEGTDGLPYTGKIVITRDELVAFIEAGGIQVLETLYAGEEVLRTPINFLEERAPDAVYEAMEDFEYDTAYSEFQEQVWDLRDNRDPDSDNFRVWYDADAGNVRVQVHETDEWLEVPGSPNTQTMSHAKQAIETYIYNKREVAGAKGPARWMHYTLPGGTNHRERVLYLPDIGGYNFSMEDLHTTDFRSQAAVNDSQEYIERQDDLYWYIDAYSPLHIDMHGVDISKDQRTRIQTFQIPKDPFDTIEKAKQYIIDEKPVEGPPNLNYESHAFPERNIMAWIRTTDRIGPNGEKILFVEEVQSDLHQEGLEGGYRLSKTITDKMQARIDAAHPKAYEQLKALDSLGFETVTEAMDAVLNHPDWKGRWSVFDTLHDVGAVDEWLQAVKDLNEKAGGTVPNMPFKGDAWGELAMKRVIRLAAEGGYDQIAWTTGQQQNERYNLSEVYDSIEYDPRSGLLIATEVDGGVTEMNLSLQGLDEYIGAERALEIRRQITDMERRYEVIDHHQHGLLRRNIYGEADPKPNDDYLGFAIVDENGELLRGGLGGDFIVSMNEQEAEELRLDAIYDDTLPTLGGTTMEVGGEGNRTFYDKLLVNVTNRAARKLDKKAKVKTIQMEGGNMGSYMTLEGDGKTFYISAVDETVARDEATRRQISPRFDTMAKAQKWQDNNVMGFSNAQHGLDITADMQAMALEGMTLFQNRNRAQVTFDASNRAMIRMSESKDLSSFLHEMAHIYLELVGDLAEMPEASARTIDDYAKILTYLGVNHRREITDDHHERLAESFEAYLREGNAPTAELQPLFAEIKGWMLIVYDQLSKLTFLGSGLDDEIRGVFDRMLATDAQIAASEDYMGYVALYATAEDMGITQRAFDVYRSLFNESHNEAVDIETKKMLKAMLWGQQQWWKDELGKVENKVRAEAEEMNVYKALAFLQKGTLPDGSESPNKRFKLDRDDLHRRYGRAFLKRLPGRGKYGIYTVKGGMDADVAAELFGFSSGDKLIQALIGAPNMEAYIKAESNRRMQDLHPDPLSSPEQVDEATIAVHNEKRGRILAAELKAVYAQVEKDRKIVAATKKDMKEQDKQALAANEAQLPKREDYVHIKAAAKKVIENKRIRDANPNQYRQAERKAGRLSREAMKRKDYAESARQKNIQIRQYEAYRAAVRAKEQSQRDQKYLKTFEKAAKRKRMGLGGVWDQIEAVLDGINFRKISGAQIDRENLKSEMLVAIKAGIEDGSLIVPAEVLASLETPGGINWQEMTFVEFAGVRDVIKQLESQADHTRRIKVNGETVILEDVANELAAGILANHKQVAPRVGTKTGLERVAEGLNAIGAALANPGHIAKLLDGGDDYGVFNRLIVIPMRRAIAEKLMPMQAKALADVTEMYLRFYTRTELQRFQTKNYAKLGDRKISKDEAISIALNQGSETGKAAFFGGKLITGAVAYAPEDVAAVLALLERRDWLFVQAVWDYNGSYWTQFEAAQKERRGIAAEKVEAAPFTVISSDGFEIKMAGGYYHLSYDSSQSDRLKANEFDDYYKNMGNGVFVSSNTRAGASHNRVKDHGEVVMLGLHVIQSNLREITRDIAIGNEINYVSSMLNNKKVRNALKLTGNAHHLDALVLWVADVAVGELPAGHVIDKIAAVARTNFTMSRLLFNFRVGLLQFAGVTQTAAIVGKGATGKAIIRYARNPASATRLAFGKSAFLAGRYQQSSMAFDRDLADAAGRAADASHGLPTHTKHIVEIVQKYGFAPIYLAQGVTDIVTWNAAYEKGLSKKGLSDSEAIIYADAQVQITQTSGLWSDRSAFERGTTSATMRQNRWMRLWATLISFMVSRSVNVYIETKGAVGKGLNISNVVGYVSNLTLLLVVDALLVSILYQKFDDDDDLEDMAITVAKESVLGLLAGVPGVRDIESAAYGSGNTAIGTVTNDLYHVAVKTSEFDFDRTFWRHTIDLFGILTGAPSSTANKMIDVAMSDDPEMIEYILGKDKDK